MQFKFAHLTKYALAIALVAPALVNGPIARIWAAPAAGGNLIANGDFEAGTEPWILCGGARLVDAQALGVTSAMVHAGRYALRIGQPIDASCGNDALGPSQVAVNDVTIPSDASDVTLSFWYSATGDWSAGEFSLAYTAKPISYLGSPVFTDTVRMDETMPGWHLYRQNLKAADVAKLRGGTFYLQLLVRAQGQPSWNWAVHFDDFRVTPMREATVGAALPADLAGDGARPLVLMGPGTTANTGGIYRIDTDGGNRIRIADVGLSPQLPTWSPDGKSIAFLTSSLTPDTTPPATQFQALTGRTFVMAPDGSGQRQVFKSLGAPGTKETPLGCLRFSPNTCTDTGLDAIDGLLTDQRWSPDSTKLVTTFCSRARWYNSDKGTRDATCSLVVQSVPTDGSIATIGATALVTDAAEASWSSANKLLFTGGPSLPSRTKGVWQLDASAPPAQAAPLYGWLTGYASSNVLDLRGNPDNHPTWAPDGRYFVTYQPALSNHFAPISDVVGGLRVNYSIMLNDSQNLSNTRMLLLTDHGQLVGRPAWSPNGRYVLYSLRTDDGASVDVWWLDAATGATGKLTNDGVSYDADWLPTAKQTGPAPTPDPKLTAHVFMPLALRSTGGVGGPTATPPANGVRFPTLTPTKAATPLPTPVNPTAVPPRGISGRVLYKGVGIGGIKVQLEVCLPSVPCEVKATAQADANGNYAFPSASAQNGVLGYQVTYRNGSAGGNTDDPRFLSYWQVSKSALIDYDYAERLPGGTFDIANVELTGPSDNAQLAVPVTFSWNSRGIAGEQYQFVLDYPNNGLNQCGQDTPGAAASFAVSSLDCRFPTLSTGDPHEWYVLVSQGGDFGGEGASRTRTITFAP